MRNKKLYGDALKALTCDHPSKAYKEIGWDEFTHSPTAVHGVCRECGMEIESHPQCDVRGQDGCTFVAVRVIDGRPVCSNCKLMKSGSPFEDVMKYHDKKILDEMNKVVLERGDDGYRGVEFG